MKNAIWLGIKNNPLTIYPMIVYGNLSEVIVGMWSSSEPLKKIDQKLIETRVLDEVELDPGGSVFTKIPNIKFEIDGYQFSVLSYKVEEVLRRVRKAEERLPGIIRFRLWFWNYMMPQELHQKLINKLEELNKTDEVMHAELSFLEQVEKLEQSRQIFFKRPGDDLLSL